MRKKLFLISVICIAIALRFWKLGEVPISPDWDEAALGYNAYSLLHTGRDEYGVFLPRVLRSFDDYKPPLYAYLTVPSVALFGLTVWSVRLASAVMGVFAVLGTFFLIQELLFLSKYSEKRKLLEFTPILTTFLLAISPWHIQFSRIAFEANSGVTLNIWGAYFFLRGLRSAWSFLLSSLCFSLALYAYHSERAFVPLLLASLVVIFRKQLKKNIRALMIPFVIGMVVVAPLFLTLLDKSSWTRLSGTSSFSDQTALLFRTVKKLEHDTAAGDVVGKLLDNRRAVFIQKIAEGYLAHFSLKWLFLTGDNDRHHAPDNGLLYLWELPFLLYGFFVVTRFGGKVRLVMLSWFFLAPVAASPTSGVPHAIRTLVFLPSFQFFVAIGILHVLSQIKIKSVFGIGVLSIGLISFAANIVFYLHMYFVHMNHEYSRFWQYGYKEAVEYANKHKDRYNRIVVSTKLEQPHIFFLFYLKYDPKKYLSKGGTASGGFEENRNHFDMFEFRPINEANEIRDGKTLFIGTPQEIRGNFIYSIPYLNGEEAIRIAE